ncbi:MAG: hypothetical protein HYX33_00920 [Actinobacteria bacterium]|nr:hypothetical protein [Actinomycetota bacterium]
MARPEVLDNQSAPHHAALAALHTDEAPGQRVSVATGYVNLEGIHHLASLADGRPTRLLLGAQPDPALGARDVLPIGLFQQHLEHLQKERDLSRFPPSRAGRRLQAVEGWLSRPEVEVRRYTDRFLHGKAYLFGTVDNGRAALVTSANLTGAGLSRNLELGIVHYQPNAVQMAIAWFDDLWERSTDYEAELRDLLFPDPGLVDPRDVYLRALLELHPPDLDDPARATRPALELAPFQRDGYERARVIARQHGGVVYADGVGTGKTEIGLAFIEERTRENGVYALVVTPAQLRRTWEKRIHEARLPAQVVSYQELASDEQLGTGTGLGRRLHNNKDAYRLVIVDEAHSLRNADTSWYRAMQRLLGGSEKQVVLLTATPINNGLWDLYNLVMLFAGHDRAFAPIGIDSVRDLFLSAGANARDPENLDPARLFPLADAVSVRRDRAFIEREYPGATFPDGTPVHFPRPVAKTIRYDLDQAHAGLFDEIVACIDALTMARYQPTFYELDSAVSAPEAQLAGLLRSGLLKRFESCWRACLETVQMMLSAHDAFLAGWDHGVVLTGDVLRAAAAAEADDAGLAGWIETQLDTSASRPITEFDPAFVDAVASDRDRLATIRDRLATLSPDRDPKLAALIRQLEDMPDAKVAVFAGYGATIRYLDEHLPPMIGGRERVVVIGSESAPDQRLAAIARFSPKTVVRPDYVPPDGEVDLLLATDVLSEGQNLQQAQAVISYDMPWNPQRVVQRNGRVIRLLSPHDEVHLVTMLPEPGDLERLLGLEARLRAKIAAASGVYGMESEVIEGQALDELQAFAERLASGDPDLLAEVDDASGAFVGEELRRLVERAVMEGEAERLQHLPWGIGAGFRQTATGNSHGPGGVFFATRTPPMPDAPDGYRYWRFVEFGAGELVDGDLEILRRIDPTGGVRVDDVEDVLGADGLEDLWTRAAADIVRAHNARADLRATEDRVGPRQRWALSVLRNPAVALPIGADLAEEVLSAERGTLVRRALGEIEDAVAAGTTTRDQAATAIVEAVMEFGLQPVEPPPIPETIAEDDLGVVCWMAVLPEPTG